MTKRQYEKIRSILADAAHNLRSEVEAVINIASLTTPMQPELADLINSMHDAADDAEKRVRDLDDAWTRRNWTAADYASRALIVQNID